MEIAGNNALASIRPKLKRPVLIFGAGQVAQVFAAYLEDNGYDVAAFVVDREHLDQSQHYRSRHHPLGIHVVPFDGVELHYLRTDYQFVVGMSFRGLNAPRAAKFDAMRLKGFEPLTFVDRNARVSCSARIGAGAFIMDGNVIQPYASIGSNTILWSGNHIGHHSKIGDHVFVASQAVISGAAEVGDYSFVGVNATVRDNVKVGARCVIGAGALILSDCEEGGVYSPGATERSKVPSHRLRGI